MNSTLFSAASGATCSPTPEDAEPAMIVVPLPISSVTALAAFAGSAASSDVVTSILRPLTSPVPSVA